MRPLGEWRTQSVQVMNKWLEINCPYIKNSVQQARERQKQQVRDIRHWCTPLPKPATSVTSETAPPDRSTTTRISIKSTLKTIKDYFSGNPKKSHQSTGKNHRPPSTTTRVREIRAQKYIQTMLKITKRSQPSSTTSANSVHTPSVSVQTTATSSTSPQDKHQDIDPANESVHKASTIANLVKKFERWKTGRPTPKTQQNPDKNPTL